MDASALSTSAPLFDAIAPVAERTHAVVVDGGTDAGVMRLMGRARAGSGATFPLLGVAPEGGVKQDAAATDQRATLEPNHSHFALVPGDHFGDESGWLAEIAAHLAGGRRFPAFLINGGELSLSDAQKMVEAGGDVVAISGTGRSADRLAAAIAGEADEDLAIVRLVASGHIFAEPADPEALAAKLERTLIERMEWPA